ncbi:hypothetical protein HMSSN036_78210 [Paenibacillus macerans]|nr:hypothetical protein HMSSN036_78210 [Paenibacillus macerans]
MMLKWDHTVQYVNDLDTPVEAFAKWGLTAFKGGSHKFWGTYNALSYFGLTYIEFLGIEDRALAEKSIRPTRLSATPWWSCLPAKRSAGSRCARTISMGWRPVYRAKALNSRRFWTGGGSMREGTGSNGGCLRSTGITGA